MEKKNPKKGVAILTGNGLSIAFNQDLALSSITREVLGRIEEENGDEATTALKALSSRIVQSGDKLSDADFEVLVGAFGLEYKTLGLLENLSTVLDSDDSDLSKAFGQVSDFVGNVRIQGLSHVLEVIMEYSELSKGKQQELLQLIDLICSSFSGSVTFGNLNYDSLLLTALLKSQWKDQLADIADGRPNAAIDEVSEDLCVPAHRLRKRIKDFPEGRRIWLLHLHGSICYWNFPEENTFWKVERQVLKSEALFKKMRAGQLGSHEPAVVLSSESEKQSEVDSYPFNLAYEGFSDELNKCPAWIIIGYSFRDIPVNEMLKKAFLSQVNKPKVFVSTYGSEPSRQQIEQVLGWGKEDSESKQWLFICDKGAFGFKNSPEWKQFLEQAAQCEQVPF